MAAVRRLRKAAQNSLPRPPNKFDGWTHDQLCTFLSQPGGKYPCTQGSYHLAQPPQAHVRTEAPAAADSLSDQALKADLATYPNLAAWCNAHHITHLLDDNGQPAVTCVKANHMTDAELSAAIFMCPCRRNPKLRA
jgi:hypothetical protein